MNYWQKLYRKLIQFLKLSLNDKLLIIQATLLLIFLRISLKLLPFNLAYSMVKLLLKEPVYSYKEYYNYTQKVIWAIERSGRYLLRTKCLAEALAVHILLNKKRIGNYIHLGFIKINNQYSAHAWVTAEDKILIGGNQSLPLYFSIPLTGSKAQ